MPTPYYYYYMVCSQLLELYNVDMLLNVVYTYVDFK
jgi:hypothetical protein